jgi:hypothetical protein
MLESGELMRLMPFVGAWAPNIEAADAGEAVDAWLIWGCTNRHDQFVHNVHSRRPAQATALRSPGHCTPDEPPSWPRLISWTNTAIALPR